MPAIMAVCYNFFIMVQAMGIFMEDDLCIPEELTQTYNRLIRRLSEKQRSDARVQRSLLIYLKLGGESLARKHIEILKKPMRFQRKVHASSPAQTQPAPTKDSTKPVAQTEPVEPVEASAQAEPVEPVDASAQSEPVEPAEESAQSEPVEPAEESAQPEPVEPADASAQPEPVDASAQPEPVEPVNASAQTEPSDPVVSKSKPIS